MPEQDLLTLLETAGTRAGFAFVAVYPLGTGLGMRLDAWGLAGPLSLYLHAFTGQYPSYCSLGFRVSLS